MRTSPYELHLIRPISIRLIYYFVCNTTIIIEHKTQNFSITNAHSRKLKRLEVLNLKRKRRECCGQWDELYTWPASVSLGASCFLLSCPHFIFQLSPTRNTEPTIPQQDSLTAELTLIQDKLVVLSQTGSTFDQHLFSQTFLV